MGRGLLGAILLVAVSIVAVIGLALMWVFGVGFFSAATADFRGEVGQREETLADPDYRMAAYDEFFALCTSVQNAEADIAEQERLLNDGPTGFDKRRIETNLAALRAERRSLINEYNNNAGREATVAQFHASNLPDRLDPEAEETECVAPSQD